jgi:hypothetical protein
MGEAMSRKTKAGPRWKCSNCGSTDVDVQYGRWFRETTDYELTETGSEDSGPEYFFCNNCESSDDPEDLTE